MVDEGEGGRAVQTFALDRVERGADRRPDEAVRQSVARRREESRNSQSVPCRSESGDANAGCSGTPILNGLTCSNVSVTGIGGAAGYPDRVSVQIVNYTYQPLFDLGRLTNRAISLNVNVSPSTTMRYLLF